MFDGVEVMDFAARYEILNLAAAKFARGVLRVTTRSIPMRGYDDRASRFRYPCGSGRTTRG